MEKFIVAITRACGSGGMSIGKLVAEHYGINVYNKMLLQMASDESGISEELFANTDEDMKRGFFERSTGKAYTGELVSPSSDDFTSRQNLFAFQAKVLKDLAEKESYVVVGRAADYVLRDYPNLIRVYIHAPREICIEREMRRQNINHRDAMNYVDRMNKYREEYYNYHTGRTWNNANNYDLCLDTSKFTYEEAAELIKSVVRIQTGIE